MRFIFGTQMATTNELSQFGKILLDASAINRPLFRNLHHSIRPKVNRQLKSNIQRKGGTAMKKDFLLDEKLELGELRDSFLELDDVDDLWYFVKSSDVAWIAGSTG